MMYGASLSLRAMTVCKKDLVSDLAPFTNVHPTIAVVDYNVARLHVSGHPVATIKAVHAGPNEPRLKMLVVWSPSSVLPTMLTSNLRVDMHIVANCPGLTGTVPEFRPMSQLA